MYDAFQYRTQGIYWRLLVFSFPFSSYYNHAMFSLLLHLDASFLANCFIFRTLSLFFSISPSSCILITGVLYGMLLGSINTYFCVNCSLEALSAHQWSFFPAFITSRVERLCQISGEGTIRREVCDEIIPNTKYLAVTYGRAYSTYRGMINMQTT